MMPPVTTRDDESVLHENFLSTPASTTVTTFASNSTYFFQVFLAENLDKKRLLLLFQCGGDKYTYDLAIPAQLD
ncbi:hypothetical protein V7S43_016302 [Phytophthora oleae]|uniref:Uncharacterized protein n=1 Tax=Phytophthora oleae TaxID=2107226 RepID=A0ABD3EWS3_9STRA